MPRLGQHDLLEPFDPLDYLQSCECPPELIREIRFVVFDEYINSTTSVVSVFTSADYNSVLAAFDQLSIQCVADQANSSTLKFSLRMQHSADGETWLPKATLISLAPLVAGQTNALSTVYDDGSYPTLGLVRFIVSINGDVAPVQVKVKITVSVIDSRWRAVEDLDEASARVVAQLHEGQRAVAPQPATSEIESPQPDAR